MNSFTKKVGKAIATGVVLSSLLLTMACNNDDHAAESAPTSPAASQSATPVAAPAVTQAPIDTGLSQAQKDAAIAGSIAEQFKVDPSSVAIPADVKAAFGEKASAYLVHDTFAFQQMTDGFRQLQVLPRTVDMTFMAGIVNAQLSPMMTPDLLAETVKQFSSPGGTAVIPMFTADDFNGISVDGTTYHPNSDGFIFNYGAPVVTMGTTTLDVVQDGQTIKVKTANVSMQADILIPASEGTVKVNQNRSINLIAGPDGHWLVCGFDYPFTITATSK